MQIYHVERASRQNRRTDRTGSTGSTGSTGRRRASTAAVLCAATALAGCGGGGFEVLGIGGGLSANTAATNAANATLIASDTVTALEEAVMLTQVLAQAVTGTVTTSVQVACATSGSAVVSISGGTSTSVRNGLFDATEVYQVVFNNCRGTAAGVTVNGTLTISVSTGSGGNTGSTVTTSNLLVTLPRGGSITLTGDSARQTTSTPVNTGPSATDTVQVNSRYTSQRMASSTQLNGRNNSFTLTALDLSRQGTWQAGVAQSSSLNGSHTLAATLLGQSFSHTVSTDGIAAYAANGLPATGRWVLNVGSARLVIAVAASTATVQVDDGNNGSIDNTYSFPVTRLQSDAG